MTISGATFMQVQRNRAFLLLGAIKGFLRTIGIGGSHLTTSHQVGALRKGESVRVRRLTRSPLPEQQGVLISVSTDDPYGSYLVQFKNGLRFRYDGSELEASSVKASIAGKDQSLIGRNAAGPSASLSWRL